MDDLVRVLTLLAILLVRLVLNDLDAFATRRLLNRSLRRHVELGGFVLIGEDEFKANRSRKFSEILYLVDF